MGLGHVAGELADVVVGGGADHLVRRTDLDDLAVAHDEDPVAELERLGEVVGDEDAGLLQLVLEPDDLVLHVAADQRVEGRERLVEEQHPRVAGQRPRQPDALLHAAGELVGVGGLVAAQPHQLDDLGGLGAALLLAHAADLEAVGDVVDDLAVRQQPEVLEDHRDVVAAQVAQLGGRRGGDVVVGQPDLPGRRLDQARQAPHERRLARAGEPHDHEDLAGGDVEGDVLDAHHAAGLLLQVGPRQVGVGRADDLVRGGAEDLPEALDREGAAAPGRAPSARSAAGASARGAGVGAGVGLGHGVPPVVGGWSGMSAPCR